MVIENVSQRGSKFDEMSQNVEAIENYLNSRPKVLEQVRRERIQKKIDEGQISGKISNQFATSSDSNRVAESILKKLPKEAVIDDKGVVCPTVGHAGENIQEGVKGFQDVFGSVRQIALWLDKIFKSLFFQRIMTAIKIGQYRHN